MSRAKFLGVGAIAAAIVPASALAVNIQTHVPSANSSFVKNESGASAAEGALFFGLDYNFLNDPLVQLNPSRERRLSTIVEYVQTLDMTVGKDFGNIFALGASVPMHYLQPAAIGSASSVSVGDVRLFSKIYLLGYRAPVQVALMPEVTLPTGDESRFLSDGSVSFGARVAVEKNFGFLTAVANVGYRRSPSAVFREIDFRNRLPITLGVSVPVTQKWAINAEGSTSRSLPWNGYQNPAEFYGGARYQATSDLALTGGAALGGTREATSADYRVLVGLRYSPVFKAERNLATPVQAAGRVATPAEDVFRIDQDVLFAHASAEILPSAKPWLTNLAKNLKARARVGGVVIEGHTNELGTDAYNLALSRKRAAAVRGFLISQGLDSSRLRPMAFGERQPKATAADYTREERLRINRRVEFKVEGIPVVNPET